MDIDYKLHLTPEIKRELIKIFHGQNACNLSGIVYSWKSAMDVVCAVSSEHNLGTDWKNNHPINVLYASKVASLTNSEHGISYSHAYDLATELIKEREVELIKEREAELSDAS